MKRELAMPIDDSDDSDDSDRGFISTHSPEEVATLIQDSENDLHSIPGSAAGFPNPGKGMLNYFSFEDGYLNLNNGLYSTTITCIPQAVKSQECC